MCGIAGIHIKDRYVGDPSIPLEGLVDGLLLGIEERGKDATGYVAVAKGAAKVSMQKDNVPAEYFVQLRDFLPDNTKTILLHTRAATQGDPKDNANNHPVVFKTCFATHNGMIYNDSELFGDRPEVTRPAAVDSCIVPVLVSECGLKGATEKLADMQGSYALAIIDPIESPDELLLVRGNSSPLVYIDHEKFIMWASTYNCLETAWKAYYGTPPKWDKFQEMEEGHRMYIGPGDTVEIEQYMEVEKYVPRRWSDATTSRTYRVIPMYLKGMCFECGDRQALAGYPDYLDDTQAGTRKEWYVPVCIPCYNSVAEASELTYAHADRKLQIVTNPIPRSRQAPVTYADDACEFCNYYVANIFKPNGDKLCRSCDQFHQDHARVQTQSVSGSNLDLIDKFNELKPGDIITSEIADSFKAGCEACNNGPVKYVSEEGYAICTPCREGEVRLILSDTNDMVWCDGCDNPTFPRDMKDGVFGRLCGSCRRTETLEPEDAEFDVICEDCQDAVSPDTCVDFHGKAICAQCAYECGVATETVTEQERGLLSGVGFRLARTLGW